MSDKANVRAKSDRDVAISTIEENRRLRAALETFGQHADWCGVWDDGDQPCECGLRGRQGIRQARSHEGS